LACLPLSAVLAQSTGGLVGRVTDASNGAPLAGVEVHLDSNRALTRTDRNGEYRFRGLVAGMYELRITWPGYRPAARDSLVIRAGDIVRIDVRLAPLAVDLQDLVAVGVQAPVLDPLATQTVQRITAED